nr:hypothetical protein [Sphingomonas daechungensis]
MLAFGGLLALALDCRSQAPVGVRMPPAPFLLLPSGRPVPFASRSRLARSGGGLGAFVGDRGARRGRMRTDGLHIRFQHRRIGQSRDNAFGGPQSLGRSFCNRLQILDTLADGLALGIEPVDRSGSGIRRPLGVANVSLRG